MLRSETAGDAARAHRALAGLRAYQQAERTLRPSPMPIVARAGRASLRDYGGAGPSVVFVPSLINPPDVLDLAADNSLLRWLSQNGIRPLLVDWGTPDAADRDMSVAGHVEALLLPLLDALDAPAALAGYCLGGTMAIAAAARRPPPALALIAAPWRFDGFPGEAREAVAALWPSAEPAAAAFGLLPMEVLQASFWRLDPARTVGKFEAFAGMDQDSAAARAFVALEDWANDGPPLTLAAARELLVGMFGEDVTGRGAWRVAGDAVDPASLACPVLDIVSTRDRIVPQQSAVGIGETLSLDLGHVGMVVGSRARERMWEPLARWLAASHMPR